MGKQVGTNFSDKDLGLTSHLLNNPVIQAGNAVDTDIASKMDNGPQTAHFPDITGTNISKRDFDYGVRNGANFSNANDPTADEHALAGATPWTTEVGRSLLRFVPMAGMKFIEQTQNLIGGVAKLTGADQFSKSVLDPHQAANEYINGVSEDLKHSFAGINTGIPGSTKYDDGNLADKIMTAKFWTDDIADGAQFVLALAAGSKGLAGGTEAIAKLAKSVDLGSIYESIPVTERIATATANNFTTKTVGFLNAAAISGMQAKGTANQIQERLRQTYSQTVDPETGMHYTPDKVEQKIKENQDLIDQKTNSTFWATMATELGPSIFASKLFLGAAKEDIGMMGAEIKKAVNEGRITTEDIAKGTNLDVLRKTGFAGTLKQAGHAAAVGALAMNLQQSIQQYDVDQAVGGRGGSAWDSKFGYVKQFLDNITSDEGIKGMVLGAVLGAGTAAIHGFGANKGYNEAMDAHLNSMRAADGLFGGIYGEALKGIYQTDPAGKLVLDENGNTKDDYEKIKKLVFGQLQNKELFDSQTAATISGNSDMAAMNEHVALAQAIASEFQSGRYETAAQAIQFLKWFHGQRIKEQGQVAEQQQQEKLTAEQAKAQSDNPVEGQSASVATQTAMSTGSAKGDANISKAVNENSMLIDKMAKLWDQTGRQAARLSSIGDTPARTLFNENVRRTLFYEGVKRESLMSMMEARKESMKEPGANTKSLDEEQAVLGKLHQDSLDRSSDFINNNPEVFKAWDTFHTTAGELANEEIKSKEALAKENTPENARAYQTRQYMSGEFSAKEGIGSPKDTSGWVKKDESSNGTNLFAVNQNALDRQGVPIGMRNEQQFRIGSQFKDMSTLNSMLDEVSKPDSQMKLSDVLGYAESKKELIDKATHGRLIDLVDSKREQLAKDKETLSTIPQIDPEAEKEGFMDPNPEYGKLDSKIKEEEEGLSKARALFHSLNQNTPLDQHADSPEKSEERLNKRFAESHFEGADNVLNNALESDGSVKDTYADDRAVNRAIDSVTRMRNAIEDRLDKGDLKGQESYRYLIEKADQKLAELNRIQEAVVENGVKRDGIQRSINEKEAHSMAMSLGFDLAGGAVVNQAVFGLADQILGGKLRDMLSQVTALGSRNFYEGMNGILHAIKSKGDTEGVKTLISALNDQAEALADSIPTDRSKLSKDFAKAPELYLIPTLRALSESKASLADSKTSPINRFRRTNDIDQFEDSVFTLPEGDSSLSVSRENILAVIKAYKGLVGINRTRNILESSMNLLDTVGDEITNAQATDKIVPTTQQEISIRDGLAWLHGESPGTGKNEGWAFLRGIAGTGKTNVVVKWMMKLSGIKPEEILAVGVTDKSTQVLARSIGTDSMSLEKVMEASLDGKKHVILDEYARATRDELDMFEKKIREINKTRTPADRIRVLILGDPSQISPELYKVQDITDPISNPGAKNIRVLNPLTIVYRSDVSAVNQTSDLFQDNPDEVKSINVRASGTVYEAHAVGSHTGKTSQDILDAIKVNKDAETGLGLTPRSRVIIVDNMNKARLYDSAGVPVISVYDAQSETYDEAYVDIDPKEFNYDTSKFNSAIYTGASRAKEYSFIKYQDGQNTVDAGLNYEKQINDLQGNEAKADYIKTRTEEQGLMSDASQGKPMESKAEAKIKEVINETPLEKDLEPSMPEEAEITTETPDVPSDQTLPGDTEPDGPVDPVTEKEVVGITPVTPDNTAPGERILPNIESAAYTALKPDPETGQTNIDIGTKVHYMYTQEPNGQDAVTVLAMGTDGNWVPVSKIFQEELTKYPQYKELKAGIDRMKTAGVKPLDSDFSKINPRGNNAGKDAEDLKANILQSGSITRHQRLTYDYTNDNVPGKNLLSHITDLFKSKFYHKSDKERAKADKVHYKIFRNSELTTTSKLRAKFGDFIPDPGIPYAIIGIEPGATNYRDAQFVRLTANRLSQQDEHYSVLKQYRDTAKEVAAATGIQHGSIAHNKLMRALKESLEIKHEDTPTGTEPRLRAKEDFTREQLAEGLHRISEGTVLPDELEALLDSKDSEFNAVLPKLQSMALGYYGVKEKNESLTEEEMKKKYGESSGYEHIPYKDTESVAKGLGKIRLKGTGDNTGKAAVVKKDYEVREKAGPAQKALNQLAKANEFAGNIRIRVKDYSSNGRAELSTGKDLASAKGGDTGTYKSIKALAQLLGESKVAKGELTEDDLSRNEVKAQLEKEVRERSGTEGLDVPGISSKLLNESGLDEKRQQYHAGQIDRALRTKETMPVTMDTLDMIVGDHNYDADGNHRTEQEFNVQKPNGKTKTTQTYIRKPLDIDQFNKAGLDPKANGDTLAGMVGTKLNDIYPTQVAVDHDVMAKASPEPKGKREPATLVGSKEELVTKIRDLSDKIDTAKGKEKIGLMKERAKLIAKRDSSAKLFDSSVRRSDAGAKITIDQARAEIRTMLPGIKPEEMQFLNKATMLQLQRPGENLLGLFANGKILLAEDDGSVHANVVRHEVFHAVFNDYLSGKERQVISDAFDPMKKLAPSDLEEAMADHFMTWQREPETYSGKVKRIFNKLLSWVGFARSNADTINDFFKRIEGGKFQDKTPETSNTRMAFSDISKYGTVQDYKNASREVQSIIYDLYVDNTLKNSPLIHEEVLGAVQDEIRNRFNQVSQELDSYVSAQEETLRDWELETDPELKKEHEETLDFLNKEVTIANQKYAVLHNFVEEGTGTKMLKDMWKDLYPNFNLTQADIAKFEEDSAKEDPQSIEYAETEESDKANSGLQDFTIQSDERNNETKVTDNVKNFLSFVYRPKTVGKEGTEASRVNPRFVYLQSLKTLAGLSSSDPDFIAQLQGRATDSGINLAGRSDAALVINHIIKLYHDATAKTYQFKSERTDAQGRFKTDDIELASHNRFMDQDTFISHTLGKDVRGLDTLTDPDLTVIKRDGRSTTEFLGDVAGSTGMAQAKAYFRQMQAQESLREVMSTFLSQRESVPMIAEQARGVRTILKYFRAQNFGIERIKTTEVENAFASNYASLGPEVWKDFNTAVLDKANGGAKAIRGLLKAMGIKGSDSIPLIDNNLVKGVIGDLKAFEHTLQGIELGQVITDDSDETGKADFNPVAIALANSSGLLDRLTRLLTLHSADQRPSSYMDVGGTKRYLFHNGSQAYDTIGKLINYFDNDKSKLRTLPGHFSDPVLARNIFASSGINQVYELTDHDGQRQEGKEDFATTYSKETNAQWLKRNFSDGFLSFMKANSSNSNDPLKYVQSFYTISNRPRMSGAVVRVLPEAKIHEALVQGIKQHVEQSDLANIKNYDRFKAVNFDEMHKAIEDIHKERLGGKSVKDMAKFTAGRVELARLYDQIKDQPEMQKAIAEHMIGQLKEQTEGFMDAMRAEKTVLPSDLNQHLALMRDPRKAVIADDETGTQTEINTRREYPDNDMIRPAAQSFYMNNYVNSFFLNQAVTGNMNYFKSSVDMIKRMSGVFAPGTKGIIGNDFFLKQHFNVAISRDVKLQNELSDIFKGTKLEDAVKAKAVDIADAQGYMLPERAANIVQGFGKSYDSGSVFKPAHYEVADRGDGNYVPVMLKYSSVVLSDDLAERFPKLKALRDEMRAKGVHEFIFDTGDKVGAPEPKDQTVLPGVTDYENNNISIKPESVIKLSNENFRLQLNPNHEAYDKVSNPTQLGYFLNVLHKGAEEGAPNLEAANQVYNAIGEKITRGITKLGASITKEGKFSTTAIKSMFTGVGNERLHEMLSSGIDYNMPNMADKALIAMANLTSKQTVKVKFPGGKMVLQASYGADIPKEIPPGQERFWSEYGQNQSKAIEGQARRLEYQQDSSGRWHAEVIMPMSFKGKMNEGDFLHGDGMGFRIPSTELHSSVPLKVTGFYDDKGSNVVIAPAELVAQHGSDFDVDSLYVISREQPANDALHPKGTPVGYYKNADDKYVFDKQRYQNELDEAKMIAAGDKKALSSLEKVHDQFLNNQITEAFLDTISHPANKQRMLAPISTEVIDQAFKEIGIKPEGNINTSRLLDNMKMFNSNFQGASLVGIFANGMKALSYMSRAGKGEGEQYPQLQGENPGIVLGDHTYDSFTELDHTGKTMWEVLDALVNTSVDNVKDQKLYLMNATDRTGPVYIAAKAIGMPLPEAMRLMLQPVIKRYSTIDGTRNTIMNNLKSELAEKAIASGLLTEGQKYSDIGPALQGRENALPGAEGLTSKVLDKGLQQSTLGETPEEVAQQYHTLTQFEKLNKIGEGITTFSRAISILQEMPVFYKDIATKVDLWESMGGVNNGKFTTDPNFSMNLDNLFEKQPNIKAAYDAFQWMKGSIDKSLIKHFPEVQALARQFHDNLQIKLGADKSTNVEAIKNEIMSYMVSSYYADSLKNQEPVKVAGTKGKERILTGKAAWGQEFVNSIEQELKANRSMPDNDQNPFLKRIGIKDKGYGIRILEFANSSNPTTEESMEMQEGFGALKNEDLKHDLVKYAALNYGMSFGVKNYSMFIPSEYIKPLSDYISGSVKDKVQSSKLDENGVLVSGPLKNMSDHLAVKLSVNNIDKLPYISSKEIPSIHTLDEKGQPAYVTLANGETVPVKSGYDGEYFWNQAYENPLDAKGNRKYTEPDFPQFIRKREGGLEGSGLKGRDVAYIRVNDADSDKVYYQKLGYKNYAGGYEATNEALDNGYKIEDHFAKGTIPVAVPDISKEQFESRSEHIKPGQRVVVYPYSNDTRELGKTGIVEKVTKLGESNFFTLIRDTEAKTSTPTELTTMAAVASELSKRSGIEIRMTDGAGMNGAKGMIRDGVIHLDYRSITPDTAFHEVSHPLVEAIAQKNPSWYQALKTELNGSPEGREILRKVQAKYPELSKEAQEKEALVTAIGNETANKIPASSFRELVKRLMRSIGSSLKDMLRVIKGKSLNLDDISNEDMVKLKISDIAEILASDKSGIKLDLSKVQDEVQYSKDLDEEKTYGGVMDKLLEQQDKIKDPELDSLGQQGDTYTVEGSSLTRISKAMDGFTFRKKEQYLHTDGTPMTTIEAIARREADRMFKNTAPGTKLIIDGVEMSKDEFEKQKQKLQFQGQLKGDIIHAQLQRFFTSDPAVKAELTKKIDLLSSQSDVKSDAYNWITDGPVLSRILENAGINIGSKVPPGQQDTIHSEVKVASLTMGIAGKIDQLVEKPDGRLRIIDWKTGAKLKNKYTSAILKYGMQENNITDNPLDRAKLQVMMYALAIKAEHPDAKFEGLTVMHIPNEYEAKLNRNALSVEVPDYLKMVERYYRHEEPAKYKQMIEKSPSLFDPHEYNAPRNADYTQDVLNSNGASEAETLQKLRLNLQKLVMGVEMRKSEDSTEDWTREEKKARNDLMKKILQGSSYIPQDFTGELDSKYEIGVMTRWLGNLNDTHNPYIQAYAGILNSAKTAAHEEFASKQREFKSLLGAVLKEKGITGDLGRGLFGNKRKAFANLWEEKKTTDPDTGSVYMERGLAVKGSEQYERLSNAEKALSDHMSKEMKDMWVDVMVTGKNAIVGEDARGRPLTKQDIFNSPNGRRGAAFEYKDNFVPRVAITQAEVAEQSLGKVTKDWFVRKFTDYFENNIEGYNQKDYGLPVRFMGNANTYASPESYSMDLQLAYERYMEQMISKKHLDNSWALGQALKGYLETRNDENGNPAFKQSAGFVKDQIDMALMGNRVKNMNLTRKGITAFTKDGMPAKVSLTKLYRTMKSGFAASSLWLQPLRSSKNAIQLEYMQVKEGAVNGILRQFKGTNTAELDLSPKSFAANMKEAMASQGVQLFGNPDKDFIHQLAKTLRLYPDMSEMGLSHNDSMTRSARLLNTANFGYLYQMPEEVTSVQFALSMLKNMKVQGGNYKGKSMYDMYKNSFDKETGEFKLPADFSRGKIQLPDGTFEPLAGLHANEVQHLHRGIYKLKGGYRSDEKTALQATILGDSLMMFKRWIPGMMVLQWKSKYSDPSTGQFEKVMDADGKGLLQRDGEDVYAWRARIVEGRWKTLGHLFMSMTSWGKMKGYGWSDLSTEQKKGVIDASIAFGTYASMLTIGAGLLGKRKEEDTARAFMTDMTGRLLEQWSTPTVIEDAIQPPAVVKKAEDLFQGFAQLIKGGVNEATGGDPKDTYTNKGDRKGLSLIEKNTPFASSYYEIQREIKSADKSTLWDEINPYN